MAKLEAHLVGSFDSILSALENEILNGSVSASFEDGSSYRSVDGTQVAVRVYERYSCFGGNRVSMNLTLIGSGQNLFLSVITSGGSQAIFFKFNTFGEEAFLDTIRDFVQRHGGH